MNLFFIKGQDGGVKSLNKMVNWDWLITIGILTGLVLAVWAKVSGQTVMELIRDIGDFIREKKEDATETGQEIIYVE